jgi:hypothetical protein
MNPSIRFARLTVPAICLVALTGAAGAQGVVVRPHPSGAVEVVIPTGPDGSWVLPWGIRQVAAMTAGQTLDIRGVVGSVRVTRSTLGDMAPFTVTRADGGPAPRVVVVPGPTSVTVCAVYPSPNPKKPNVCRSDGTSTLTEGLQKDWPEVTFEVGLPDGVDLAVHVVTGNIRADAPPERDVTLQTGKGRIAVVDYGAATLRADSMAGDVQLTLAKMPLAATRTVSSSVGYGTMYVRLPETTPIRAYVSGRLSSVFPLEQKVADQYEGTIGPDTMPYVILRLSAGLLGKVDIQAADDSR